MMQASETIQSQSSDVAASHPVEAFFRRLGDDIAAALGESREAIYANLEQVALAKLEEHNPSAHISHADLIDYVLGGARLCKQADLDAKFAEPPLSLYCREHFDISALTWLDGTTSIHQHAFCGAFHVLQGSSIHSRYRFKSWQTPEPRQRAVAGALELIDIEVLRAGDTRVIRRGESLIHALFHMIRPSVTIVIRTITDDPNASVQYDYRWPGLAHDPFHRHALTHRKLQYLRMLRVLDGEAFPLHLERVLAEADLCLAYTLVSEQVQVSGNVMESARLASRCLRLPLAERKLLALAVNNDLLSRTIIDCRRKLHVPEHRFLLALLLNVFDRAEFLRLVQRETGCEDPIAQVCAWVAEISGNTERYPNLIGIDFNDTALDMLACMLEGLDAAETLTRLASRYGAADVVHHRVALCALYEALQQCALFHALFEDLVAVADGWTGEPLGEAEPASGNRFGNLRLVSTASLSEYESNNELFLEVSQEAFAQAMLFGAAPCRANRYRAPWLLYHAWRRLRIPLDEQNGRLAQDLIAGSTTGPEHELLKRRVRDYGWCDHDQSVDLDQLVERTRDAFPAIQNSLELRRFLEHVRDLKPRVVVEIGTARGGMLYCFSQLASRDATLVSIDLPGAPNCGGQTAVEREVFATFGPATQRFGFIPADSHLPSSKAELERILAGRKIDLLFIDGDHSYEGCLADFEDYRHLVASEGLIAFHDICLFPDEWHGVGVGVVWRQLKARYGGVEIVDLDGVTTPHLQPGKTARWGIGLIQANRLNSGAAAWSGSGSC